MGRLVVGRWLVSTSLPLLFLIQATHARPSTPFSPPLASVEPHLFVTESRVLFGDSYCFELTVQRDSQIEYPVGQLRCWSTGDQGAPTRVKDAYLETPLKLDI